MGSREIAFDVDGDRFTLAGARINDIRECDVELVTTRTTILDLVDARVDLLDACLQDRLVLRAMPTDLLAFHDALLAYLHGAVRSPSFPSLLREYRSKESP